MATNPVQILQVPAPTDGMDQDTEAHALPDTKARTLYDVLVNRKGMVVSRGAVTSSSIYSGLSAGSYYPLAMFGTIDPEGNERIALVVFDEANSDLYLRVWTGSAMVDIPVDTAFSNTSNPLVSVRSALGGGVWIGVSSHDGVSPPSQGLFRWRGGTKVTWSGVTGFTASINTSGISRAAGGFNANVTPGMFVWRELVPPSLEPKFLGVVKSVNSDTSITLETNTTSAIVVGDTLRFSSYAGFIPQVSKGTATVASGGTEVTGGNTRFKAMGVASGWQLFRKRDNTFVGTVTSVTDDDSLTLTAGAAIALTEEEYVIVPDVDTGTTSITTLTSSYSRPGFLTAAHAERQWYANRGIPADASGQYIHKLWFSELGYPYSVDFSPDGDSIDIESSGENDEPIKALFSVADGLIVFKKTETFLLTGDTPDTFSLNKIANDGVIDGQSIQPYRGGVIWAGTRGIYYYDAEGNIEDLLENGLSENYRTFTSRSASPFNPAVDRMYSAIEADHYVLVPVRDNTLLNTKFLSEAGLATEAGTMHTSVSDAICIYLPKRAITLLNNLRFRGTYSSVFGGKNTIAVVWTGSAGSIINLSEVFRPEAYGTDTVICDQSALGIIPYIQTKQYDGGSPSVRKIWKMLLVSLFSGLSDVVVETIVHVSNANSVKLTVDIPATGLDTTLVTKRKKFIRRSQHLGFRIYLNGFVAGTSERLAIARLGLVFRPQRIGRT